MDDFWDRTYALMRASTDPRDGRSRHVQLAEHIMPFYRLLIAKAQRGGLVVATPSGTYKVPVPAEDPDHALIEMLEAMHEAVKKGGYTMETARKMVTRTGIVALDDALGGSLSSLLNPRTSLSKDIAGKIAGIRAKAQGRYNGRFSLRESALAEWWGVSPGEAADYVASFMLDPPGLERALRDEENVRQYMDRVEDVLSAYGAEEKLPCIKRDLERLFYELNP